MSYRQELIRVILPAGKIPLGSDVTKKNGEKPYILRDRIRIFTQGEDKRELIAQEGTRILISETGDANAIPNTTDLVWHATRDDLDDYLADLDDGPAQ